MVPGNNSLSESTRVSNRVHVLIPWLDSGISDPRASMPIAWLYGLMEGKFVSCLGRATCDKGKYGGMPH